MDHVDWLDEAAACLLAARLAEQVLLPAVLSHANMCLVLSIDLVVLCLSMHMLGCKLALSFLAWNSNIHMAYSLLKA